MKKFRTLTTYQDSDYGNLFIEEKQVQNKPQFTILWDFYLTHDEYKENCISPEYDIWQEDTGLTDFTDMPKDGLFNTFEEAEKYLYKKFKKN